MPKARGYPLAKQFEKRVNPSKLANSERGKGFNNKLAKNAGK